MTGQQARDVAPKAKSSELMPERRGELRKAGNKLAAAIELSSNH